MLDLTVLQAQIVLLARARIEEWGAPEAGETEDVSSNVAEAIGTFASALMPTLDNKGCLAVLSANPDWFDAKLESSDETLRGTVRSVARATLCESCLATLRPDIEAYIAEHWPIDEPGKGLPRNPF